MPQDTAKKNLCKHTQDAQTFLVTPTKGISYIHGTSPKMTVCIDNAQHPLIIDSGVHCSIVARMYLANHLPNWKNNSFQRRKRASNVHQKLGLLKILRQNRPAFAIGEEPLEEIRGHDIELYLDVERPYPPILRRPQYPESLETRKEIEKHIIELLDMDVIRKIGHNEISEITTPVLITWHDGKSRLCGDFRGLNNYSKGDRYPIPRIPHVLDKLAKAKYIANRDCMKGFHQNGVKPNSMKVLRIIFHMGIYEYTRMPFGIKNAPAYFQRIMDTIFQEEILEGWIWPLDNVKRNPAYATEVAAKIPIHFMEIDRRQNSRISEWARRSGTPDSGDTDSEGKKTLIL
ncbi:hypothetical protein O181_027776 [Austropuccinia psidii MF-1]|uniref:Reverse transcriptase domain-containing protein n=1 Tax=Austropuccinia psidii MF-1 TaxID=1389203 RepID=A0A9Q3CT53_9BASI|nr:hypothetical protein [Austropuccinia psidii MF-1]